MLDLPVGTAKTRIRDGLIRLRDTMGVGDHDRRHSRALRRLRRRRARRHRARPVRAAPGRVRGLPDRGRLPARGRRRCSPRPPHRAAAPARPGARRHRASPAAAARGASVTASSDAGVAARAVLVAAAAAVAIGAGGLVWQQVTDDVRSPVDAGPPGRRRRALHPDLPGGASATVVRSVPQRGSAGHRGHAGRARPGRSTRCGCCRMTRWSSPGPCPPAPTTPCCS